MVWLDRSQADAQLFIKKIQKKGWRDGSAVKSICCSSKGLGLDSQGPHGDSQLFVTPVWADLRPFSGL